MDVALERVSQQLSENDEFNGIIIKLEKYFDLLVLGETEPSLRDRIFGDMPAQVTVETEEPRFVVRDIGSGGPQQ